MAGSTALLRLTAAMMVVCAVVRPGDGLQCYDCTSDKDPNCETKPQNIATCENLPDITKITGGLFDIKPVCLKAVVRDTAQGGQVVMRSCVVDMSVVKTCDIAKKMNLPPTAEIKYCGTCQVDLCNSSDRLIISFLPLLLPCIITLILSSMY